MDAHTPGTVNTASAVANTATKFTCNTCGLDFESSQDQRSHMRDPWHVYNLKRRLASLPPISAEVYDQQVAVLVVQSSEVSETEESSTIEGLESLDLSSEDDGSDLHTETAKGDSSEQNASNYCIFCTKPQATIALNIKHMQSRHGLYIPQPEHLISLDIFIQYLSTVINNYNECLYCGISTSSPTSIKQHMHAKGHSMINLERELELLEFWDFSGALDSDNESETEGESKQKTTAIKTKPFGGTAAAILNTNQPTSASELHLPSGKVVGSNRARIRSVIRRSARMQRSAIAGDTEAAAAAAQPGTEVCLASTASTASTAETVQAAVAGTPGQQAAQGENAERAPAIAADRRIAVRGEMGLVGVSEQQRRSMAVTQRKLQKREAVLKSWEKWRYERSLNRQAHYRACHHLSSTPKCWKI